MSLGNTPSRHHGFQLEQFKSFAFLMKFHLKEVVDDVYLPYSLVGATVRLVVRAPEYQGGDVLLEIVGVPVDAAAGTVRFSLQAADLSMDPDDYPYDITLITESEYSTPVMKGVFTVGSNTDTNSDNVFDFTSPGTEIDVEIHNGATVNVGIKNPDFLRGPVGPPQGIYVLADKPGADSPLEYVPLWVDTDEDPIGTGPPGPAGPPGPQGDGLHIDGTAPAWMMLPTSGVTMGDVFYVVGSDQFAVYTGSSWEELVVTVGPPGPAGDPGAPGTPGAPGDGGMPAGTVIAFAGPLAPSGWALCNGAAISRVTYAALWSAIGTTFGAGDGTTTFNLPDLRNRVPVGAGTRARGVTGGAETVALSAAELPSHAHSMPAHAHGISDHTHTGTVTGGSHDHPIDLDMQVTSEHGHAGTEAAAGGPGPSGTTNPATTGVVGPSGSDHSHTLALDAAGGGSTGASTVGNTGSIGSGTAHENMQPYLVLNYIIKT